MKNVIINLGEVDKKGFYSAYTEIMQPLFKLRNREKQVLALLLYYNNEKKNIDKEDRYNIVFNINTRKKISQELSISNNVIQQVFNGLREKNIIKGIKFNPSIENFIESGEIVVGFKLKINE